MKTTQTQKGVWNIRTQHFTSSLDTDACTRTYKYTRHAEKVRKILKIRDTQIVCPLFDTHLLCTLFPFEPLCLSPKPPTLCPYTQMGVTEEDFTTAGRKPHRWRTQGIERLLGWIFKGSGMTWMITTCTTYYMYYWALKCIKFVELASVSGNLDTMCLSPLQVLWRKVLLSLYVAGVIVAALLNTEGNGCCASWKGHWQSCQSKLGEGTA